MTARDQIISKLFDVVDHWWEKSGKKWAKKYKFNYKASLVASNAHEALSILIGYPHSGVYGGPPDAPTPHYIVDIDTPRVARIVEAIHANPDALLKMLEIQYDEAHGRDNE